jgi:hypothetical protein
VGRPAPVVVHEREAAAQDRAAVDVADELFPSPVDGLLHAHGLVRHGPPSGPHLCDRYTSVARRVSPAMRLFAPINMLDPL